MSVTYEVRNIMSEKLISIEADSTLGQAMKIMVVNDIGSVIITSGGIPKGILTERDILKDFTVNPECSSTKIQDVMSSPLITISATASIGKAADVMAKEKIRRLLVSEGGEIQGIVTERDIMKATLYAFKTLSDAWI